MYLYEQVGTSLTTSVGNVARKTVRVRTLDVEAELIEVTLSVTTKVLRQKAEVSSPHWLQGQSVVEDDDPSSFLWPDGSKRPGVYLVRSEASDDEVKVKIRIKKVGADVPATFKLVGALSLLRIEGDCPSSVGVHEVVAKIINLPSGLARYAADATWQLRDDRSGLSVPLSEQTRLEIFVLLNSPMAAFSDGVWAEALRFMFHHMGISGLTQATDAIEKVTTYCHTGHEMVYDTISGAPHFNGAVAMQGGEFQLMDYMKKLRGEVNCYDQASVVCALANAIGIGSAVYYLQPFGYINTTNLVGVGMCNNPFYRSNRSSPLVNRDSDKRTSFGNHAFAHLSSKVEDACAGPHSDEARVAYLASSIDAEYTKVQLGVADMSDAGFYDALDSRIVSLLGPESVS